MDERISRLIFEKVGQVQVVDIEEEHMSGIYDMNFIIESLRTAMSLALGSCIVQYVWSPGGFDN